MKYPVRVTYPMNNRVDFKMLTLEEANQKFVVIDGKLFEQEIKTLDENIALERLKYAEECMKDYLEDAKYFHGDVLKRTLVRIGSTAIDILVLKQAVAFFKQLKGE
jgi:hypothetical protein